MVQVVENWADLVGRVRAGPRPESQWWTCEVEVEEVRPVDPWPNLLQQYAGQVLSVRLREEVARRLGPDRFVLRARLAGPGVVWAATDPDAVHPG